ncbi:glycoside hydrolase family 10 protein [Dysgonomonas macrotermitis]|uniref:Uncharacterized lipoprotein YddW, UPF0748 family n=1 Tax=Dysgonomonas macrotermitis TaxID=1346286 RepID=A0A1M4UBI8_9BACT|nr:family 10 glycosylhydrolase [Dysgonomonas macrotermitis]SHE53967.1 Uncharacterized lipoprotein YddW, UPF0748 family [Dysgonomonas macrotermitis]
MKKISIIRTSILFILSAILLSSCGSKKPQPDYSSLKYPKREFRGAWIQTAWQGQYQSMNSQQMRQYFVSVLNNLQAAGINAVIFQVRPQADAFYYSEIEPWSNFMTGTQGKGLPDGFDPLAFLVEECHKRNMELHAWLNPYRVSVSESQVLVRNHIYYREPERFVKYGTQIFFDPGIPSNREYICKVVKDIVKRYDVDAIHMDDYFYPYPIAGKPFPDDRSFAQYGVTQGFDAAHKEDWRRNNVNSLIKELKETIVLTKPWVRFGISPFGIYRNKRSTPNGTGSNTNGLQNYDDLYADVKLWVKNGWIDYNMPQVYWEIGHKAADYATLIQWWSENNFEQPLYIGQDIKRTMDASMPSGDNQLSEKMRLSRSYKNVHGNSFWYALNLVENYRGVTDALKNNYHKYPALIPAYTHMHKKSPKKVKSIKEIFTNTEHRLAWESDSQKGNPETASYYVIYRFRNGQAEDLNNPENIVGITRENSYVLPYEKGKNKYKYVITAVDSFHNESKGNAKKVTL